MADWLNNVMSHTEQMLNNIDRAAATKLAERGDRRGSSIDSLQKDEKHSTVANDLPSSSVGYTVESAGTNTTNAAISDKHVAESKNSASRSGTSGSTASSKSSGSGVTSDQLFDFLNDSTASISTDVAGTAADHGSATSRDKGNDIGLQFSTVDDTSGVDTSSAGSTVAKKKRRGASKTNVSNGIKTSRNTGTAVGVKSMVDDDSDTGNSVATSKDTSMDADVLRQRCTRLDDENQLLRREVAALTDEVSSYMTRVRSTQDALSDTREALAASERKLTRAHSAKREFIEREDTLQRAADTAAAAARELEEKLAGQEQMLVDLRAEKDMLLQDHADASHAHNHALSALRAELEALQASKADTHGSLEASRTEAEDNLRRLRDEHDAQTAELSTLRTTLATRDREVGTLQTRAAASDARHTALATEFAEYKTKVTQVLQMKDKTITALEGGAAATATTDAGDPDAGGAPTAAHVLEARVGVLEAENAQLRSDLREAEAQQQEDVELAEGQFRELEQALKDVQGAKVALEKDHQQLAQANAQALEDAVRQKELLAKESAHKDSEMVALQEELAQLKRSTVGSATLDLETKVRQLTDNVVKKQGQIEALSSERSSLALQLEEMERRRRQDIRIQMPPPSTSGTSRTKFRRGGGDDDEYDSIGRALQAIMGDSANSGVGRSVKGAAVTLDAVSVQFMVFLRRYAAARLMTIVYLIMVHLWVMVVLLTYTPEIHDSHAAGLHDFHPVHPDHVGVVGGTSMADAMVAASKVQAPGGVAFVKDH
eukprot:m.753535 g.753535  ORF g.753535 m.753535 type:complete len:776 (-) comp23172_c0_seq1:247-2574(-)